MSSSRISLEDEIGEQDDDEMMMMMMMMSLEDAIGEQELR